MNKQAGLVMVRGHIGNSLKGERQAEGKEKSKRAIEQREEGWSRGRWLNTRKEKNEKKYDKDKNWNISGKMSRQSIWLIKDANMLHITLHHKILSQVSLEQMDTFLYH